MAASSFSRTKVFISYSHKDAKHLKRLQVHLTEYERNKLVEIWDDTKIAPGASWRDEIEKAIDSAKVAILLVSADFLASDFVVESELPRLLTAAKREGTIILPVILSPCGFEDTELSQFQAVNSPLMPLTRMTHHQKEELWARVAKVIRDTTITHKSESRVSNYQQSSPDLQILTQRALQADTETVLQFADANIQSSLSTGTYERELGATSPGYFIVLLDQSASMGKPFGIANTGRGKRKCDMASETLNNFLNELITVNIFPDLDGTSKVMPRADVTVLGYSGKGVYPILSGALGNKISVSLPELQMNPSDIEMRRVKDIDDTGREFQVNVPFPNWVKPKAEGDAPMCAALQRARELAELWTDQHPNNYPPIVINITSGIANDGNPAKSALQLRQVGTTDGQTLLYNVQISEFGISPILYPSSKAELPDDQSTKQLFLLSSNIPENSRTLLESLLGKPVPPGARGFIFNGDIGSLQLMFHFADQKSLKLQVSDLKQGKIEQPIADIEQPTFGVERLELDEAMLRSQERLKVQDPDLKQGKVEVFRIQTATGSIERPWGVQSGFAVVYKFRTKSSKMRALRVFTVSLPLDIQFRYERISAYFALHIPNITVVFKLYENGIIIKKNVWGHIQSRILALIEMEWVEGVTLLEHVDELCQKRDRRELAELNKKFVALVQAMHQAKVAHGDLSGIDIMVRTDGSLTLVDYDGVYIPDFAGLQPLVLGQADYQHPQMYQRKFNEQMDNFSILVIQTALLALQAQPDLWDQYAHHNTQDKLRDTNLLFRAQDFLNPDQSSIMTILEQMRDPRVKAAVQALKQACLQSVDQVEFQLLQ